MPVADPDGRDRSIDWYFAHNVDITDYEKMSGVPYWGKYIKHDNNRDINYSGMANQNFLRWYLDWHPPIIHDLHESVPFLYIYSGQAPQNPLWDPIVYSELPMLANWDMTQLSRYGMPGVWTHAYVDAWSPGYVAQMATNHNGLMRFYEIMGNAGASTMERTIFDPNPAIIGGGGGGMLGDLTKRQWYRPDPPYKPFSGPCATTPTTRRPACSPRSSLSPRFPQTDPGRLLRQEPRCHQRRHKRSALRLHPALRPGRPDPRRLCHSHSAHAGH